MNRPLTLANPAYFDTLARFEADHWWSAATWSIAAAWLDHALKGRRDVCTLDVGCGAGGTLSRLAKRPWIGRRFGLDPSADALGHAAARVPALARGSALNLPFASRNFELATCFDVWQHLPGGKEEQAAGELRRVLRPGGLALIRANGRGLWPGESDGRRPYRLGVLVAILESAGFAIERASYVNGLPGVGREVLCRLRGRPRSHGHPSGGGLRENSPRGSKDRLMRALSGAEAWAVGKLGMNLPAGHSTMVLARVAEGSA